MLVFLIGMMGSGKSTFGRKLASFLQYDFIDLDAYIEERQQISISELFEKMGEDSFRKIEHQCLIELSNRKNTVVSTGGGAPCFFNNMELINTAGISVYLKAESAFLASRLKSNKKERPLIAHINDDYLVEFLDEILHRREKYYSQALISIDAKDIKPKALVDLLNFEDEQL